MTLCLVEVKSTSNPVTIKDTTTQYDSSLRTQYGFVVVPIVHTFKVSLNTYKVSWCLLSGYWKLTVYTRDNVVLRLWRKRIPRLTGKCRKTHSGG